MIRHVTCHSQALHHGSVQYKHYNSPIKNSDEERKDIVQLISDKLLSTRTYKTLNQHCRKKENTDDECDARYGGSPLINSKHRNLMRPHQILGRVFTFWSRAGPIIAHYQLTRAYFTIVKRKTYTREYRDVVYDKLHDRYAPIALGIILDMKGMDSICFIELVNVAHFCVNYYHFMCTIGLFIKLGQVLSSRPDFVPHQYTDRFSLLQDCVTPWDVKEIQQLIEQSLNDYQHVDFDTVFESLDPTPLGCASIGKIEFFIHTSFDSSHN